MEANACIASMTNPPMMPNLDIIADTLAQLADQLRSYPICLPASGSSSQAAAGARAASSGGDRDGMTVCVRPARAGGTTG